MRPARDERTGFRESRRGSCSASRTRIRAGVHRASRAGARGPQASVCPSSRCTACSVRHRSSRTGGDGRMHHRDAPSSRSSCSNSCLRRVVRQCRRSPLTVDSSSDSSEAYRGHDPGPDQAGLRRSSAWRPMSALTGGVAGAIEVRGFPWASHGQSDPEAAGYNRTQPDARRGNGRFRKPLWQAESGLK